jgi:quercetin dioxygenase-like cupin family protein
MNRFSTALIPMLVLCAPLAQPVEVSPAAIRSHVAFLADDLLAGREPGTAGFDIAARYVATQLEGLGLEPAGESGGWYQKVPLQESALVSGSGTLSIAGQRWQTGTDVMVSPSALEASVDVEAPVVFAGFGLDAPEHGFDDYRSLDVRGKIVAVFIGSPRGTPSELGAHLAAEKVKMAERRGAIGVISLETLSSRQNFPWARRLETDALPRVTWVGPDDRPYVKAPGIRVSAAVNEVAARALFAGARQSYDSLLAKADRKGARPRGFALSPRVRIAAESGWRRFESPNVLGMIPGSDPRLKDEVVLMMAHLDHIGIRPLKAGEQDGDPAVDRVMNGAMDNATGVATMLEVARVISASGKRPRRSILFFANTAEEKGLLGADYFARHPTLPIERIVGVVNLDMPLLTYDFSDVVAFGGEHSTLGAQAKLAAEANGVTLAPDPMPEQGLFTRSDHYALVKQGVPAVFFATGQGGEGKAAWQEFLQRHYHQSSDDLKLPFKWDAAARFARINRQLLREIADAEQAPRWHEGDFFGITFAGPERRGPVSAPGGTSGSAQAPPPAGPPGLTTRILTRASLSGDASREVLVISAELAAGARIPPHVHPGDEYATVLEGTLELRAQGSEARNIAAGASYHNARGVVHETVNVGVGPARILSTFVVDRGAPLIQPVPAPEGPSPGAGGSGSGGQPGR